MSDKKYFIVKQSFDEYKFEIWFVTMLTFGLHVYDLRTKRFVNFSSLFFTHLNRNRFGIEVCLCRIFTRALIPIIVNSVFTMIKLNSLWICVGSVRSTRLLLAAISYVEIPATQTFRVSFTVCKEVLIFCRFSWLLGSALIFYSRNRSSFKRHKFTFIHVTEYCRAEHSVLSYWIILKF
jgi:hypothetical protein